MSPSRPSHLGRERGHLKNGHDPDPFWNITPRPPKWALDAGLPAPNKGEGMGDYVNRLGLSYYKLIANLDPRAAANIHLRLVNLITESVPEAWDAHVKGWIADARR